jgi:ring-1,2-phenylacetyl-CoA epoxidase subunit PaaD
VSTVAGAPATVAQVQTVLGRVPDPELPVTSVVDLGMIHSVSVGADGIAVAVLPTFLGCPALEIILADIRDALLPFGVPVDVRTSLAIPWTPERITAEGRRALAAAGIAPPTDAADPPCPHCGSDRTVMDNAFGPTQCRSLHYCRACRQPFEAIRAG